MPTAADMAQLGSEIVAGHRTRKRRDRRTAGDRAGREEADQQDDAGCPSRQQDPQGRNRPHAEGAPQRDDARVPGAGQGPPATGAQEHAAQTSHMLGEFQQMDKARQEGAQEHAAQERRRR